MKAEYVDHMGDDLRVVDAARVSFNKRSEYSIENGLNERDSKLISYLANHNHFTPFTHPQITICEKVPIFVARQRFKHTIGFTYNEVSRRYVDDKPEFFTPDKWRGKPINAKQGSSDEIFKDRDDWELQGQLATVEEICLDTYQMMIRRGVAPEQARMVLPQSMYTEYMVTGSLAAWARAYKLRSDPHAQVEIQELAKQWNNIIGPLFSVSWKALTT